ncbi:M23 family metallopeptidase [Gloeobacter morelensis]|uniref:M23 family metallopeptidase n=1 Tax=Gloeobacter morelensis MG652769 TaxID=2781736 RepID=A0ABY3PGC0_9CYAN|nr:M23 family metallopeptidase [Gloeobacter morelensis]UFP92707.1 M23 family metallopeptidase [Gloeobacter morelensis MG652769]
MRRGLTWAAVGLWVLTAGPAAAETSEWSAADGRLLPERPVPGSTVQVLTKVPVGVRFGERDYPSFEIDKGRWRVLVPLSALLKPGEYPLEVTADQETRATVPLTIYPRSFAVQRLRLPRDRAALEATPTEEAAIGAALRTVSPVQLWQLPFRRPSGGRVSSGFGLRRTYNGVWASGYYHRGLDFAAPAGARVIAPAAGRVALVGTTQRGFRLHGNTVVLDHGQGVTSIYIHLSRILVRQGETVKAGQPIAKVGSTGRASGPHLHWGIYAHAVAVDPGEWLAGRICCRVAANFGGDAGDAR